MNTKNDNVTRREWSDGWGQPLVTLGCWTIAEDDDELRLYQLYHGCQHGLRPVTQADLEELVVCVRRALALLSDREGGQDTEGGS